MKNPFWLMLTAFAVAGVHAQGTITVTNPRAIPGPAEVVEVQWKDIAAVAPDLKAAEIEIRDASGNRLATQTIDLDGDANPDLLLFRSDFGAGEKKEFRIGKAKDAATPVASLTDARYVLPREDVGWESDRIAFRMYGPALAKDVDNGIDVWTKRVRSLIVAKWYREAEGSAPGKDSYHVDRGEGADFFNVGRTLGAGSCALWTGDSLVQPGVFASHRIISTGPLRAVFEVTYPAVQEGKMKVSEVKRISLDAGSNLNRIEVTYTADTLLGPLTVAAGIVKRPGVTATIRKESGWVSLWGLTTDKEENGSLGTAVVAAPGTFQDAFENGVHVLMTGRCESGKSFLYYSGAGWTRSGDFTDAASWEKYLDTMAKKAGAPMVVSVSR